VYNNERQQFFGGSAAQSPIFPFLDVSLGVTHDSHKSQQFLSAMRDYMLRPHREFLQYLEGEACLLDFVTKQLEAHGLTELDTLDSVNAAIAAALYDEKSDNFGDAAYLESLDLKKVRYLSTSKSLILPPLHLSSYHLSISHCTTSPSLILPPLHLSLYHLSISHLTASPSLIVPPLHLSTYHLSISHLTTSPSLILPFPPPLTFLPSHPPLTSTPSGPS
jgi:hypothetical protein